MPTSTYLKFRGALYRKADQRMDRILSRPPGKNITWGPEEWPSDDYLASMPEKPPVSKVEFLALPQRIAELKTLVAQASAIDEKRKLFSELREKEQLFLVTRAWLHENNPRSPRQRLRHEAKPRK